MRDNPDVQLLEVPLQLLLELDKPRAVFGGVQHINENACEIVAINMAFVLPDSADGLRLERRGTKTHAQSDETPPTRSSGTGEPSLNSSGRRIS